MSDAFISPGLPDRPSRTRTRSRGWYEGLHRETRVYRIVDGRDWVADGNFMDGVHLHPNGSVEFSQRLEQGILIETLRAIADERSRKAALKSPPH